MAYLTVAKMIQYFDSRVLVKLTDDTGILDPNDSSNIDSTVVGLYIDDACYNIANSLRYIYSDVEPGDTPTSEIETLAARMTWCALWERRGQEPTQVKELRDRCVKQLHDMAVPTSTQKRDNTNLSKVAKANRM